MSVKSLRVACVQYQQSTLSSLEEFFQQTRYFCTLARDYGADIVLFPEFLSLQCLSCEPRVLPADEQLARLSELKPTLRQHWLELSQQLALDIVAGTHIARDADGNVRNHAGVATREGQWHERGKLHITPSERNYWGVVPADDLSPVELAGIKVGINICYDIEFPELARHHVASGAELLLVPFCTDERQGYLRVRKCAEARAIENQCFVAIAGNVGNLRRVGNMDLNYAQSAIFSPCDIRFARDGIISEAPVGLEHLLVAELDLSLLEWARREGTVRNWHDRTPNRYQRWLR